MKSIFLCHILLTWAVFSLALAPVQAQTSKSQSGLYMSAADYQNNKLSFAGYDGKAHKIRLKDLWGSRNLEVVHDGQKYRFHKDKVFAYQDSKRRVFRFFNNYSNEYQILENKTVVIYSMKVNETASKGIRSVTRYFFSVSLDGDIIPLTLEKIKDAFPDDHKLHDELDKFFRKDEELISYDRRHQSYRINHVLGSYLSPR